MGDVRDDIHRSIWELGDGKVTRLGAAAGAGALVGLARRKIAKSLGKTAAMRGVDAAEAEGAINKFKKYSKYAPHTTATLVGVGLNLPPIQAAADRYLSIGDRKR